MNIKYNCIGGNVISQYDDQMHYIPAHRLPELYGVNPRECVYESRQENLILLTPINNGDYTLPTKSKED